MRNKNLLIILLILFLLLPLFACEKSNPSNTIDIVDEPTKQETKNAISSGLVPENLQSDYARFATIDDVSELLYNLIDTRYNTRSSDFLDNYLEQHDKNVAIKRYELADMIFNIAYEFVKNNNLRNDLPCFAISDYDGSLQRVKEGKNEHNNFEIWDCPDIDQIDKLTNYKTHSCNYCILAFAIDTGDKIMELDDKNCFKPNDEITLENAIISIYRFNRSIEDNPEYINVNDIGKHTIDPSLYTGETTLPNASNSQFPEWKGFNISYASDLTLGALCYRPDDIVREADIKFYSSLGANFLHTYISWNWFQGPAYTKNILNETRLKSLDQLISWGIENDIHIQLVFSDIPNIDNSKGDVSMEMTWEERSKIFTDETVRDETAEFWGMLARRYADIPNNYLSFNLMNECSPLDDENYAWAFEPSINAIRDYSPDRIIVADIHDQNITGESMAELGCALSYHLYEPRDIALIDIEIEEASPGFYKSVEWPYYAANAIVWGPEGIYPELIRKPLTISGNVGDTILHIMLSDIQPGVTMKINCDNTTIYNGMANYIYHEDIDMVEILDEIVVDIPEGTNTIEIICDNVYSFTIRSLKLEYTDNTIVDIPTINDNWQGMDMAQVTIDDNKNFTSNYIIDADFICTFKMGLVSCYDLKDIADKHNVGFIVGEFGVFETGEPMSAGLTMDTFINLVEDQTTTFNSVNAPWSYESIGKYCVLSSYPRFNDIEYYKLEGSPYYVNTVLEEKFKELFNE